MKDERVWKNKVCRILVVLGVRYLVEPQVKALEITSRKRKLYLEELVKIIILSELLYQKYKEVYQAIEFIKFILLYNQNGAQVYASF